VTGLFRRRFLWWGHRLSPLILRVYQESLQVQALSVTVSILILAAKRGDITQRQGDRSKPWLTLDSANGVARHSNPVPGRCGFAGPSVRLPGGSLICGLVRLGGECNGRQKKTSN
jgi:hypothetical protein